MKNFWEIEPKYNDKNQLVYADDCMITVLELGETKEYTNRNFQSIAVAGPTGDKVYMSISYAKTDTALTPGDMNKPLPCRVKVENNTTQYAFNGRKYTFALVAQQGGGGGGGGGQKSSGGGGGGYRKDTPEEIKGKCLTLAICASLKRVSAAELASNLDELSAHVDLVEFMLSGGTQLPSACSG